MVQTYLTVWPYGTSQTVKHNRLVLNHALGMVQTYLTVWPYGTSQTVKHNRLVLNHALAALTEPARPREPDSTRWPAGANARDAGERASEVTGCESNRRGLLS